MLLQEAARDLRALSTGVSPSKLATIPYYLEISLCRRLELPLRSLR